MTLAARGQTRVGADAQVSVAKALVVVKNTFVDVEPEPRPATLRCSSAPPATGRARCMSEGSMLEESDECSSNKLQAAPAALPYKHSGISEAETTCETSEGEGGSTSSACSSPMEAQMMQSANGGPVDWNQGGAFLVPMVTPMPLPIRDMPNGQLIGDGQSPSTFRLSSKAKAWTPGGVSLPPPVPKGRFVLQCEAIMAAVKAALASCQYVCGPAPDYGVEVKLDPEGWCITTHVHPAAVPRTEQILSIAKEALLCAATQSETVYVLGYSARPFQATPWGFIARMGDLQGNWHHACKDIFRQGYCPRGEKCYYGHPGSQATVNFMVQSW